jgi:hypothetical protein
MVMREPPGPSVADGEGEDELGVQQPPALEYVTIFRNDSLSSTNAYAKT